MNYALILNGAVVAWSKDIPTLYDEMCERYERIAISATNQWTQMLDAQKARFFILSHSVSVPNESI